MTPQQLKDSILQRAIEGKLVEQRPEEGTGEELHRQIQEEKDKLIKEGKLKKQKPLPEITEKEKPFEIPESWTWARLQNLVYNHGQKRPDNDFSYIDIGSINNTNQCLNVEENIISPSKAPSRARKIVEFGDILYATVRPYLHNMCIVNKRFQCEPIASTGFAVMAPFQGVYNQYLFYYLMSPVFDQYANSNQNAKGVAYPAINDTNLYKAPIPLPPLAEQKRIVAKIEELQPYVERYEKAWEKLEAFNAKFPEDMKKSLLQYAIEGKLVEQRRSEGTGKELYARIQDEKTKLIKEGKLKKQKPLPDITDDEKPFEIPESWMWVRLGEIGDWASGATPARTHFEYYAGNIPWLKTGDLNDGHITSIPESITKQGVEHSSVRLNPVGSVLMAMYGATIGKLGILDIESTTNQACCACICYEGLLNSYLFYFLLSQRTYYQSLGAGGAQPNISKEKIVNSIMPLPPLAEQKRIVARLEQLLPYCEQLKKN